ncbi:MAG: hypothetical protein VB046_06730 [Paludibacter sp.]|nr:hypothetical protein [Paludibacter sp.]
MKKLILLFSFLPLFFSCEEAEIDVRDQYTGEWDIEMVGNMSLVHGSDIIYTVPMSGNSVIDISKNGDSGSELNIDGLICVLSGNKLLFDAETETQMQDGVTMQVTVTRTGTINSTIISIKETYSGVWQTSSANGIITGSSNHTLTKK